MKQDFIEIETLLTDFIAHLRVLNQCMLDDQRLFSTDDLAALEKSDSYKLEVNSHLKLLIDQLMEHAGIKEFTGDLFVKLASYAETLDASYKPKFTELVEVLGEEYKAGLQLMYTNRQVVNANLMNVKELLSHLTQTPLDATNTTYDQSGIIS
jgi:aspartokinase